MQYLNCMEQNEMVNTKKALLKYNRYLKRWVQEWKRMENSRLPGVEYTEQFFKRCRNHREYLRKIVGVAFYEDTQEYNTLSNCLMVVSGNPDQMPGVPKWLTDLVEIPWPDYRL